MNTMNQDFNTFKIYSKVSDILEKNNPIIAYYLKTYTLNKALEFLKTERSTGNDVSQRTEDIKQWLGELETLKASLSSELVNKEQCKQQFCDFAMNLFNTSDKEFKNGNYSQKLAKDFLYVSVLLDAWEILGVPSDGIKEKKNYANEARFKIMDLVMKGVQPTPIKEPSKPDQTHQTPQDDQQTNKPSDKPLQTNHETPNEDTHKQKNEVDPLAISRINFQLTESIVVPQNKIDQYLNGQTPGNHVQGEAKENKNYPVSDIQFNAPQNAGHRWNLPVGKSTTIDQEMPVNPADLQPTEKKEQTIQNEPMHKPHDTHHLPPNYTFQRRKTPETVFYAPRAGPSIINNINSHQITHHPQPHPTSLQNTQIKEPVNKEENIEKSKIIEEEEPIEPKQPEKIEIEEDNTHVSSKIQNISTKEIPKIPQESQKLNTVEKSHLKEEIPHIPQESQKLDNVEKSQIKQEPMNIEQSQIKEEIPHIPQESQKLENIEKSQIKQEPSNIELSQIKEESINTENVNPNFGNISSIQKSSIINKEETSQQVGDNNDKIAACQEAKKYCAMAMYELDFTKVQDAKEKIRRALAILDKLEPDQSFRASQIELL